MNNSPLQRPQSHPVAVLDYKKPQVVVVTGGAGYIGSHVVYHLLEAGFTPVIIDDLSTGSRGNLVRVNKFGQFMPVFEADFADTKLWQTIAKKYEVLAVVHLAAKIDAAESLTQPDLYLETNYKKTEQLLGLLKENDIDKLVFASTAAVYGNCTDYPITEQSTLVPINPYGESKMLAEEALQKAVEEYGLHAIALRFFNAAGTESQLKILPKNHVGLLAKLKAVIDQQEPQFSIYGDDYETEDGTCIRDLVSVVDIAQAVVTCVEKLNSQLVQNVADGKHNFPDVFPDIFIGQNQLCIFNVGSGRGYSIKQILQTAEQVTGKTIPYVVAPRREKEIPISVASNSLIKSQLNFDLKYSELEDILRSSLIL